MGEGAGYMLNWFFSVNLSRSIRVESYDGYHWKVRRAETIIVEWLLEFRVFLRLYLGLNFEPFFPL